MAAALDTGQTKDSETFTCNGSIKVQNTTIRCTSTHGTVSYTHLTLPTICSV